MSHSTEQRASARQALEDLVLASGQQQTVPPLRDTGRGESPLDGLDWLLHCYRDSQLRLATIEADPAEVLGWLEQDVPLLGYQEEGVSEGSSERTHRWLVVRRAPAGGVTLTIHSGGASTTVELAPQELERELGGQGASQRWIRLAGGSAARLPGPPAGGEPSPGSMSPRQRLLWLVRPDRRDLLAVAAFAITVGVLLLATPIAVQAIVNFVALGGAVPPLLVVLLLLFLGLGFAGILTAMQTWVVEILQRRIFVRTVADFAARLPRVALGKGSSYGPELVNRYFDLETIQKRFSFLLLDGLAVLLSVLVGLVLLAFYHPILLAFDIFLLVAIVAIVLGPIRKGTRTALKESSAKYEVAAWLEEIAHNPILFKSSGVMKSVFERTDDLARAYVERRSEHFRVAFGQGVAAIALQVVASIALLGLGGFLVMKGSLTLGQLVAAELIVTLVVSSVAKLGKHLEAFYDLMAATQKIGMLLDLPLERSGGDHHLPGADARGAALELRDISWTPPGSARLLDGVNLTVQPGERVVISGPSGTGKSTLLRLSWGMLRPDQGAVRIDGRDVRELSLESLRSTAVLVDRVELLIDSIRTNVSLSRSTVSHDDVRGALEAVGLDGELSRLPGGVETVLAADGCPLSTGQAIRLQVARAIVARPRLLLVTDFFQELGEEEREKVLDTLFSPEAPWTLVLVSNSSEVLARCDRSFHLDDSGLHEEDRAGSQGPHLARTADQ